MSILCELTGHRASENRIRNAGHHFARCTRCKADLVERDGRWTTAPKGYRIVWRAAEQEPLELTVEALEAETPQPIEAAEEEWPVFNVARAIEALPEPELEQEPQPEPEPLELTIEPVAAEAPERRRSGDRRAPAGTQPKFTGVDRRRGDRRADFGRKAFEPKRRSAPVAQG